MLYSDMQTTHRHNLSVGYEKQVDCFHYRSNDIAPKSISRNVDGKIAE